MEALYASCLGKLPDVDRKIAAEFLNELAARSLSPKTRAVYLQRILGFHRWFRKPLSEASPDDLRGYIRFLQESGRAPFSVKIRIVMLKHFFASWMGKEFRGVRTPKGERPDPKPLDESEILAMIKAGATPYEKALVAVLYEGGIRLGELQGIKVGHVAVDQYGAKITVNGKSGERPIRLIHATPFLQSFLEHHTFRENPDAYLSYGYSWESGKYLRDLRKQASPNGLNRMLRRLAAKAGINGKRIYRHLLRHSRATVLSKNMTDSELMQIFGWKTRSMVSVYSHLSMRDVEDKLLRISGMKTKEEEEPSPLRPKPCPRCKYVNPATSRFCSQCSMILDLNTAMQLEEARAKADNVMSKLFEDPETQRFLAAKIKKLGIAK